MHVDGAGVNVLKNKTPADALKWLSVGAALAATATAEYNLAVEIGMNEYVAAAVPLALDAYVLRALQRGKEVFTSVLAMVAVNAASHLEHAGMIPMDWRLTTAVSAIAPLVLWRVHALKTGRARSTTEHERVPDETGDDGAREHDVHAYGFEVDAPDELDVPDWLREAQDTTRAVVDRAPVPPPPWDAVDFLKKDMEAAMHDAHEAPAPVLTLVPPLPTEFTRRTTDTTVVDTNGLNLGHVSHGRLHPSDTTYMERARFAFTEHGGGRGVVRHVKDALRVRSDRASRLVAACTNEREEGAL